MVKSTDLIIFSTCIHRFVRSILPTVGRPVGIGRQHFLPRRKMQRPMESGDSAHEVRRAPRRKPKHPLRKGRKAQSPGPMRRKPSRAGPERRKPNRASPEKRGQGASRVQANPEQERQSESRAAPSASPKHRAQALSCKLGAALAQARAARSSGARRAAGIRKLILHLGRAMDVRRTF